MQRRERIREHEAVHGPQKVRWGDARWWHDVIPTLFAVAVILAAVLILLDTLRNWSP